MESQEKLSKQAFTLGPSIGAIAPAMRRTGIARPLLSCRVSAGFPSPADDFIEDKLDLNELLIAHPAATFFIRVEGDSMVNAGIHSGDILIVDRSLAPADNKIVIAVLDGELTVKRVRLERGAVYLLPENPDFSPLKVTPEMNFEIWGVVTHVIHQAV